MFSMERPAKIGSFGDVPPQKRRREFLIWSHNVFLAKIVQDLKTHPIPAGQRELSDARGVPLGTQTVFRVQAKAVRGAGSLFPVDAYAGLHPITPKESVPAGGKFMAGNPWQGEPPALS